MIRRLLAVTTAVVMVAGVAFAQPTGDGGSGTSWWQRLTEPRDATAQFNRGFTYEVGRGVEQDHAEAVRGYRKAAEEGDAPAQFNLGLMYEVGRGVPQDYVLAHMWLNLAAARGVTDADAQRDAVAHRMTPDQIAEAQRLAREWKPSSR